MLIPGGLPPLSVNRVPMSAEDLLVLGLICLIGVLVLIYSMRRAELMDPIYAEIEEHLLNPDANLLRQFEELESRATERR